MRNSLLHFLHFSIHLIQLSDSGSVPTLCHHMSRFLAEVAEKVRSLVKISSLPATTIVIIVRMGIVQPWDV